MPPVILSKKQDPAALSVFRMICLMVVRCHLIFYYVNGKYLEITESESVIYDTEKPMFMRDCGLAFSKSFSTEF